MRRDGPGDISTRYKPRLLWSALTNRTALAKILRSIFPWVYAKIAEKRSGELKLTELVKRAQRVLNTSRKLAEERCQLEERLKSSQPTEGDDSWRND